MILCVNACAALRISNPRPASEILYQEALMFVSGDTNTPLNYALAIKKFKKFKAAYPDDTRAQEAGYWIEVLEKLQSIKNIELEKMRGN
ncbi:MAG: hypothetical protein ABII23_07530 [bacterium]